VQNPEVFLNQLGLNLACAMDPSRPAVLDSAHRAFIGFESYFFADRAAMEEFSADPLRYCGVLTDPVTLKRFRPRPESPTSIYHDRTYVFLSDSTRQIFDMMSDMYAHPNFKMLPKDSTGTEGG
jgi:hypothetical protein